MAGCIVAFPREEDVRAVRKLLVRNGFPVTGTALSGAAALSLSEFTEGGIMICACRFRDMFYTQLRERLGPDWEMILICNPSRLPEGVGENVVHLPVPLRTDELIRTLREMEEGARRRQQMHRGKPAERSARELRDIAAAKRCLMEKRGFTEKEAHRYIQRLSMEGGRSLPETALMILRLEGL